MPYNHVCLFDVLNCERGISPHTFMEWKEHLLPLHTYTSTDQDSHLCASLLAADMCVGVTNYIMLYFWGEINLAFVVTICQITKLCGT